MQNNVIKVMIADDHDIIRLGLKTIIELEDDLKFVGEARNGEKVLELLKSNEPNVLLLDINMPQLSGIEVLKKLKEEKSYIKIILLTVENSGSIIHKAINMGADGYVLKDSAGSEIVDAIRLVSKGEKYIDKSLVSTLFSDIKEKSREQGNKLDVLSKREAEVLLRISEGLSNKEIGISMYLSEKSIKNYATNIFRKLNVHDRVQAAVIAFESSIKEYYKSKFE